MNNVNYTMTASDYTLTLRKDGELDYATYHSETEDV